MKCEFELCLYNKDEKCTLKEVAINQLGMCDNCIVISLDNGIVEAEKERQLREIVQR